MKRHRLLVPQQSTAAPATTPTRMSSSFMMMADDESGATTVAAAGSTTEATDTATTGIIAGNCSPVRTPAAKRPRYENSNGDGDDNTNPPPPSAEPPSSAQRRQSSLIDVELAMDDAPPGLPVERQRRRGYQGDGGSEQQFRQQRQQHEQLDESPMSVGGRCEREERIGPKKDRGRRDTPAPWWTQQKKKARADMHLETSSPVRGDLFVDNRKLCHVCRKQPPSPVDGDCRASSSANGTASNGNHYTHQHRPVADNDTILNYSGEAPSAGVSKNNNNSILNYFWRDNAPREIQPRPQQQEEVVPMRPSSTAYAPSATDQLHRTKYLCTFCQHTVCLGCNRTCQSCRNVFCLFCVTTDYDSSHGERTLCLDCLYDIQSEQKKNLQRQQQQKEEQQLRDGDSNMMQMG